MPYRYDPLTGRRVYVPETYNPLSSARMSQPTTTYNPLPVAPQFSSAPNFTPAAPNQLLPSQRSAASAQSTLPSPTSAQNSSRNIFPIIYPQAAQFSTPVFNNGRTFEQAAADQASSTPAAASSRASSKSSTSGTKSGAKSSTTSNQRLPASTATPQRAIPAPTQPRSNITRSSDGLVSYRNGRRIDSNGNYAFTTSRSPQALPPAAAAPTAIDPAALPPPGPVGNGAFGYGMGPFMGGQVPLPPGQFYPTDIYAGDQGAYGAMPWMQQAMGNMYGFGGGVPGGSPGGFPAPGNNMVYWSNLTDPQVQRNLAVLNAQFPWEEMRESTRRDNRNFYEQARNNLFNRRATAYQTAGRGFLPQVREIR